MVDVGSQHGDFSAEWQAWHSTRVETVTAPLGPASLTLTHWILPGESQRVPRAPGLWRVDGGLRGEDLAGAGVTLAGEPIGDVVFLSVEGVTEVEHGERRLRLLERDGAYALRILDPGSPASADIAGIEAFPPDPSWVVSAIYERDESEREIELFDGYRRSVHMSGRLEFELDGVEYRLTVTEHPDRLAISFGDTTNGTETYGFRFLSTDLPDAANRVTLDFNRAHLPPCAFSDQFVCPLPTPENRLPIAVRAGECEVIRRSDVARGTR